MAVQAVLGSLGAGGALFTPVPVLTVLVVAGAVANGVTTYLLDRTGERMV